MKSSVIKRSIVIQGHKTSVSLEDAFWSGLKEIAALQNRTLSTLVHDIDIGRRQNNLSSAIRLFVLDQLRVWPFTARPVAVTADPSVAIGGRTIALHHDHG